MIQLSSKDMPDTQNAHNSRTHACRQASISSQCLSKDMPDALHMVLRGLSAGRHHRSPFAREERCAEVSDDNRVY